MPTDNFHQRPRHDLPEVQDLAAALRVLLLDRGLAAESLEIVSRVPNTYASTFPSDILRCRFTDGTEQSILCKYQIDDWSAVTHGHRRGVAYEAAVYRDVLRHLHVPTPQFFGVHSDTKTQQLCLFIEYVENSARLHTVDIQNGLLAASRWLGQFHAENEKRVSSNACSFLTHYDNLYYEGWIDRTLELTAPFHLRFPWLQTVCDQFRKSIHLFVEAQSTAIHGEFYPKNILVCQGKIYPIDWESAAVAPGEIDLASLTEGWASDTVHECVSIYQRARWNGSPPADFLQRLQVARINQEFRWLGDRYQWRARETGSWRIERVGRLARELGLL